MAFVRKLCLVAVTALLVWALPLPGVGASEECNQWGGMFTLELPAGYWTEGTHTYRLRFLDQVIADKSFVVSGDAPLYVGQVALRVGGLFNQAGKLPHQVINPNEDTLVWVGYMTALTNRDEFLEEYDAAHIDVQIDEADWLPLYRHPARSRCSVQTPGYTIRSYSGAFVYLD